MWRGEELLMSTPSKVRPTVATTADMPTDVSGELGYFDRFAARANVFVSRAVFFTLCVLLVVVWLPSYFLFQSVDTWQLVINTLTTIVTFLLVALLQNSQTRNDTATQDKLNAVAGGTRRPGATGGTRRSESRRAPPRTTRRGRPREKNHVIGR
jgi:hypothetical protein